LSRKPFSMLIVIKSLQMEMLSRNLNNFQSENIMNSSVFSISGKAKCLKGEFSILDKNQTNRSFATKQNMTKGI